MRRGKGAFLAGKYSVLNLLFLFLGVFALLTSCKSRAGNNGYNETEFTQNNPPEDAAAAAEQQGGTIESEDANSITTQSSTVNIPIGEAAFAAVFYENETARALMDQMPAAFEMADLNRNEKFCYLPENLPGNYAEQPAVINAGDIMCWSGNCLVLFYDTFSNAYGGYLRIGYIENPTGLAEAVGNGSISVTFSRNDTE